MRNKSIFFIAVVTTAAFIAGCASGKNMKDSAASKNNMGAKDGIMHNDMMHDNMMMGDFVLESGKIVSGSGMDSQLLIKSRKMGKESDVILTIQEITPTIDVVAGASTKKANIKKGAEIYAWVSSAYTASLPPKTAAKAIFVNVKDISGVPALVEVAGVSSVKEGMMLTGKDGSMWILGKSSEIEMHPAAVNGKTDIGALKKGIKVLIWKDGMMMNDDKMMKDGMKSGKMMKTAHKVKKILIIEK